MTATVVPVELGSRSYDIVVGRGVLDRVGAVATSMTGAGRAAIVTQSPVAEYAQAAASSLEAAGLEVETLVVADGEPAKSLDSLGDLYRRLARIPLGRRDVVVAVGGGVVGDLAGFAAATWNRGVAVIQVPTTLLGQVDAAIGGKTAVNLPEGKNLVGAFHQPVGVICDVETLATLPHRDLVAGLGEVAKYGLIRDPEILERLEADPTAATAGAPAMLEDLVVRSARVKAAVVGADERESGEREHLNFGHTYGHALESVTGYRRVLHGEAVAVGLCAELRLGVTLGMTPPDLVGRTEDLLRELGLPTRAPRLDRGEVRAAMSRDKKARDRLRVVVLEALGRPTVVEPDESEVDAMIDAIETEDGE
jgi:3-dehydroquinate synthase